MEDAHTTLLDMEDEKGCSFFAVFDGHGGTLYSFSWLSDIRVVCIPLEHSANVNRVVTANN